MKFVLGLIAQFAGSKYGWIIDIAYYSMLAIMLILSIILPSPYSYVLGVGVGLVLVIGEIVERSGAKKIDAAMKQAKIEMAKRQKQKGSKQ